MFGFAGFSLTVAVLLPVAGIALSFTAALTVAVLTQAGTLRIARRAPSSPDPAVTHDNQAHTAEMLETDSPPSHPS